MPPVIEDRDDHGQAVVQSVLLGSSQHLLYVRRCEIRFRLHQCSVVEYPFTIRNCRNVPGCAQAPSAVSSAERNNLPGVAPVTLPSTTTSTPLTSTRSMPIAPANMRVWLPGKS